ncbi:unnamed protein product, partial [Laminaria digitata]
SSSKQHTARGTQAARCWFVSTTMLASAFVDLSSAVCFVGLVPVRYSARLVPGASEPNEDQRSRLSPQQLQCTSIRQRTQADTRRDAHVKLAARTLLSLSARQVDDSGVVSGSSSAEEEEEFLWLKNPHPSSAVAPPPPPPRASRNVADTTAGSTSSLAAAAAGLPAASTTAASTTGAPRRAPGSAQSPGGKMSGVSSMTTTTTTTASNTASGAETVEPVVLPVSDVVVINRRKRGRPKGSRSKAQTGGPRLEETLSQ